MRTFDFYEFTGVLCPGVVVLFTATLIVPEIGPIVRDQSMTVGSFGLFVILSYVAGHLVQAFGNLLEDGFWRILGGRPTHWIRRGKNTLLTDAQIRAIDERLRGESGKPLSELTESEWNAVTRSVYARISTAGRSSRIDTFNGNYGLFRGLAASFLLSAFMVLITPAHKWTTIVFLLTCTLLAIMRMKRFGVQYARELFVQFLGISSAGGGKA